MPVRPNILERLYFYRLNRAPGPILDLFSAAGFRAVCLAIETGVFETLSEGPATPETVAEAVGAHPESVRQLLGFLEPLGYVRADGATYENAAMTATWLTGDDPNVAPWLTYWNDQVFDFWDEHLPTAFSEGAPPVDMYEWLDADGWTRTQQGFRAAATLIATDVLDAVDLPQGESTLLDVGGGHGYYAIEACRRNPGLSATIVDDPDALALAREEIERAGLEARVTCLGGDALSDDLGENYDVAFCFNVVHGYDPSSNRTLFERIRTALAAGGRLAVLDQFAGEARMNVAPVGLALTSFVYHTALESTVYEAETIGEWLVAAGFDAVETTRFRTLPGMGVVEGRRP